MNKIKELFKGRNGIPESEVLYSSIKKEEWEKFFELNNCFPIGFGPCIYFVDKEDISKMLEFKNFIFEGD